MKTLPKTGVEIGHWVNKKTGDIYHVNGESINATNAQDGQLMIDYKNAQTGEKFVREHKEFLEKFTKM